jgi:hypothetical protein
MPTTAERITREHTITLNGPLEKVFPLFEPEGEKKWAAGWDPCWVAPTTGAAEAGAVFLIGHPNQRHPAIWVVSHHDSAAGRVGYIVFFPENRVTQIEVELSAQGESTAATIRYTHVPLTDEGRAFVAALDEAHYRDFIGHWEVAINRYLTTDETLPQ